MGTLADSLNALADLLEAKLAPHHYEIENVKRWITDGDPCELCQENEDRGPIPDDDLFEGVSGDVDGPPAHPHCFVSGTLVSASGVTGASRREYEGEIIVIGIPGIDNLSVTPNHPILTDSGWLPCRLLKPGDYVAKCCAPRDIAIALDPNNHHIETRIEQIADSLFVAGGMSAEGVPVSPKAFHGDAGTKCKVDIVRAAGSLPRHWADGVENGVYNSLGLRHSRRVSFLEKRTFLQFIKAAYHSTYGVVGGGGSGLSHAFRHRGVEDQGRLTAASLLEPKSLPSPQDGRTGNVDSPRDVEQAFAHQVRLVQVLSVERRAFSGHVYNLETKDGIYFANSIISHNCECTLEYKEKRVRVYD